MTGCRRIVDLYFMNITGIVMYVYVYMLVCVCVYKIVSVDVYYSYTPKSWDQNETNRPDT